MAAEGEIMFSRLIEFIKRVFGLRYVKTTQNEQAQNIEFLAGYKDSSGWNLTYTISLALANITIADAIIEVPGDNERTRFLNSLVNSEIISNLSKIVTRAYGTGGVILKPFINSKNEIYADIINQEALIEVSYDGNKMNKAAFLVETLTRNYIVYNRVEYHTLSNNGEYTIETKAESNGQLVPISEIPEWAHIQPIMISGVEQMLFSVIKCPVDNRRQGYTAKGVPITYGADDIIKDINNIICEYMKEISLKRVRVGVDETMLDSDNKESSCGLYVKFNASAGSSVDSSPMFEVFSPEIRDDSYAKTITYMLSILEHAVGISSGILTEVQTRNATATEIKAAQFHTYVMIQSMRKNIEAAINSLIYAFEVYANAFKLSPIESHEPVAYDWSHALFESSSEEFQQLYQTVQAGGLSIEHLTAFVKDLSPDDAKELVPPRGETLFGDN